MFKIASIFLILVLSTNIFAASDAGITSQSLDNAIKIENLRTNPVVNFNPVGKIGSITPVQLTNQVRPLLVDGFFSPTTGNPYIIEGNGHTLNGPISTQNARGLFIGGTGAIGTDPTIKSTVMIKSLNFKNCNVLGGSSGLGGGGLGAGGGLFISQQYEVILDCCSFMFCFVTGGNAFGDGSCVGGGGMAGNGVLGGGGFGGDGAAAGGGASAFSFGFASGNTPGNNFDNTGISGQGGVGGNPGELGGIGGGNGRDGGFFVAPAGFGGGGGGNTSTTSFPGPGGFGGGGGGTSSNVQNPKGGGFGGFGAGGGSGSANSPLGKGGFGGGDASTKCGGAGAAFGGAIFIADHSLLRIVGTFRLVDNRARLGLGNPNKDRNAGFGALGNDIFMMSTSSIEFDTSEDVVLQNPIEGNQGDQTPQPASSTTVGGLTKNGSKTTLTLTGANTYTGTTTVEAGKLVVNGSLITNGENKIGGTLSGSFDLLKDATGTNGGDLTNEGLFELSPQTNFAGTYTQESTGALECDCSPNGTISGKTFLNADAVLNGGDVRIFCGNGNYIGGTPYKIITGNVSGFFANHFDPFLFGPNAENIEFLVSNSGYTLTLVSDFLFADFDTFSSVSQETARCLIESDHPPGSDIALAIESLGTLLAKDQDATLPSICPLLFGSLEWINARNNSYVADILADHLFELCCDPRDCCSCDCNSKVWISVFGNMMNNQKRLDNLPRYNADAVGVLVGMDTCCSPCFTYGGALGYTRTDLLWKNDRGHGDMDSYYGALYGSWDMGCCIISDFSLIGGGTCNDMHRKIRFANVKHTANSDFWSYFVTAHLGFRTDWNCGCSTFEPFVLGDYHYFTRESFHESGADSLNLDVKSKDQHFIRAEAGLLWYYENDCGCYCFSPYLGISYVGEFPLHKSDQRASFTGQSCVMSMTSYDSNVHLGAPQAGIKWSHCNGFSFLLGYKGLYNDSVRINEVEGRLEWVF